MTGEEALERVADTLERVADALDRFLTSPGPRAWRDSAQPCNRCGPPAEAHRHFTDSTRCAVEMVGGLCYCPEYLR